MMSASNPAVSVIIPTYKHRDFVRATLDSVFAQTFTDYEVLVINDGSPDDTAALLRPLADAGRIRYIEQANAGQSKARNVGIAEARGEFIALLDDDDLWPPDKLAWQVEALRAQPEAALAAGPANVVDTEGAFIHKTFYAPVLTVEMAFSGSPFISPGQTLVRAQALRAAGGFNPNIWGADDWDLWLSLTKRGGVIMQDRISLLYRRHDGNASNNLCRMLSNCCRVVETHLTDITDAKERQTLKLIAYRWLYSYLGWRMLRDIKHTVRSGKLWLVPAQLAALGKLARVLHRDPSAIRHFAIDVLSERQFNFLCRVRPGLSHSL